MAGRERRKCVIAIGDADGNGSESEVSATDATGNKTDDGSTISVQRELGIGFLLFCIGHMLLPTMSCCGCRVNRVFVCSCVCVRALFARHRNETEMHSINESPNDDISIFTVLLLWHRMTAFSD